ncbi:MAG: SPOR domain-containing protein [Rhodobacteraceae bacterium]|nr:SPOR domain-containing protein [Paracoccaceae bacterium]
MSRISINDRARRASISTALVLCASTLLLAGCEEGQGPAFLQARSDGGALARVQKNTTSERDVEAPEIFQATEAGLWDGRPSLGGVWAAHPDVADPERVIIRNEQNGKFVIGALFRKEIQTPGPRLQISSDAAAALGMLAGQPTNLNVVALRREVVEQEIETMAQVDAAPEVETSEIETAEIDPVAASAAAVLDAPADVAAPKPKVNGAGTLTRPFVQIGIFSVEQNAKNTATAMRQSGIVPTVLKQSSKGKTFWRVIVGPAQSADERAALLKKIKSAGFTDAYAVTN